MSAIDYADSRNGNTNSYDLHHDSHEPDDALKKIRTAGSISISPELFEKIYLSPQNKVKGDIRSTFGNPTPIALGGFLLSLSPLSNILLGWRGSGVLGAAETGAYFFFGGLLMVLGGLLEFVLGNTFPSVVFCTFGSFWFTYGATLVPSFNASIAYDPSQPAASITNTEFAASFGFFLAYMGVLCLVYLIASLRTNLVFFLIFLLLVPAFGCLSTAFWRIANGSPSSEYLAFQHAGGALAFGVCILGWYLFLIQLLAAVDFPINLPVVDLSQVIKGATDIKRNKEQNRDHDAEQGSKKKFWKKS